MSAEGPVLDLDGPDPVADAGSGPVRLRDISVPLWMVVLIAVVVAVAAVWLTRAADAQAFRDDQAAVVRLVVSVPSDEGVSGGGDFVTATFDGTLLFVNSGPLPVEVASIASSTPGVRINTVRQGSRTVAAGQARLISVGIGLVCRQWARAQSFEITVGVTTANGGRRVWGNQLRFTGTPWSDPLQAACPAAF